MIKTVIILAGGLGTRLKSVVATLPKPMAPIGEFPFLYYQMKWLVNSGMEHIVLSVGHQSESIVDYFGNEFMGVRISYIFERELLGTGGAIKQCMDQLNCDVFIVNGDTFFPIDLKKLNEFHRGENADITIALKEVYASDRYGTIKLNNHRIETFEEKKYIEQGYINGGIYIFNKNVFDGMKLPEKFSLETDFLQLNTTKLKMLGLVCSDYFIDIGIPDDYARGQLEIPAYFKN